MYQELTGADASLCFKLVLNEAMTYDRLSGTGGVDGSMFLSSEEASLPYNKPLAPLLPRLRAVKEKIDVESKKNGQGELSYADLEVLAAKVALTISWIDAKAKKTYDRSSAEFVNQAFGEVLDVKLGRTDRSETPPQKYIPKEGDDVEKITEFFEALNNPKPGEKPGFLSPKPQFWERPAFLMWTGAATDPAAEEARLAAASKTYAGIKKDYDSSRKTITRTVYEVDFTDNFAVLSNLGAKFNPDAYLYDATVDIPTKF